jgi:hypothetical protein
MTPRLITTEDEGLAEKAREFEAAGEGGADAIKPRT